MREKEEREIHHQRGNDVFPAFYCIILIILQHVFCWHSFHDPGILPPPCHFFHVSLDCTCNHILQPSSSVTIAHHLLLLLFCHSYSLYDLAQQAWTNDKIQDVKLEFAHYNSGVLWFVKCMKTVLGWYRLSKVQKSFMAEINVTKCYIIRLVMALCFLMDLRAERWIFWCNLP